MSDADALLRELNHRVKNNFQIIVSLMNLKSRMLPPDRQEDIRFLQEHVQSMAVAYRLVYDTGEMAEVSATELLREVVSELSQIAKLGNQKLTLTTEAVEDAMGLDQAIAFGLFLAMVLPPCLDRTHASGGKMLVAAGVAERVMTLSISGNWGGEAVQPDPLRIQLHDAYMRQLHAEALPSTGPSDLRFRFPLEDRRPAVSRSVLEGSRT